VRAGRLRTGELVTVTGGVVLLLALFLPWFSGQSSGASGWRTLGWLVLALAVVAVACAAWLATATAAESGAVTRAVGAAVLAATVGPLAFGALALRVLVLQPGPNTLAGVRYGAWLGLVGAAILAAGAWWALSDERTDAPESAYEPPVQRPAPPPRAS
jgi:hypothetical protein